MIRVENLTKYYGDVCAIKDVDFTVRDGEILGFLGPNGAGKTTTLRIITTYLTPTEGTVYIDDLNIAEHSTELRARIGYLPELNPLYAEMAVYELLAFAASVRGITGRRFKEALGRSSANWQSSYLREAGRDAVYLTTKSIYHLLSADTTFWLEPPPERESEEKE